jgi:hypothetical protein
MHHEIMRVLLVTPPCGTPAAMRDAGTVDWSGLAASLRLAGLQSEVCDGSAFGSGPESIDAHIEHFWPQVVVTTTDATTPASAWTVLESAKNIVPGVVTVMSGAQAGKDRGDAEAGRAVDHDLRGAGDHAELELLARLREIDRSPGLETPGRVRRRTLRALSATWLSITRGR